MSRTLARSQVPPAYLMKRPAPKRYTIRGVNGAQSFTPNPASCAAGQTVVFYNADTVTHRVVLDDQSVDTGPIAPGASSAPQQLGAINKSYHCSLHPSMVGSLNSASTPDPPPCTGYCG